MKTRTKAALIIGCIVGMPLVWYATYRWMQGPLPEGPGEIHTPQGTNGPAGIN